MARGGHWIVSAVFLPPDQSVGDGGLAPLPIRRPCAAKRSGRKKAIDSIQLDLDDMASSVLRDDFSVRFREIIVKALACVLSAAALWASSSALALDLYSNAKPALATYAGTVVIKVTGTFNTAVSSGGSVSCSGATALVPAKTSTTISTLSLALLLAGGGVASSSTQGAISNAGKSFSCTIAVPYRWENIDASSNQLAIAYTASGSDPGTFNGSTWTPGTHPGKTRKLISIVPVPTNGATTTVSVAPIL